MEHYSSFGVDPLDATFGAIVTGIKLANVDALDFSKLYDSWLEFGLLIFPGQFLSNQEQITFAQRFGDLEFDLASITNVDENGQVRSDPDDDLVKSLQGAMGWHCDSTFMPIQAKGAVFTAHTVPSSGGETGWSDMCSAHDNLDKPTQKRVADLSAYPPASACVPPCMRAFTFSTVGRVGPVLALDIAPLHKAKRKPKSAGGVCLTTCVFSRRRGVPSHRVQWTPREGFG